MNILEKAAIGAQRWRYAEAMLTTCYGHGTKRVAVGETSGGSERQLPGEKRVSELVMLLRAEVQQEFKFSHWV